MSPLTFISPKLKMEKKVLRLVLISSLVFIIVGGYVWLQGVEQTPEINWELLLGQIERVVIKESPIEEEELSEEEREIVFQPAAFYEETAQPGEGITHLARKALKRHLEAQEEDFNLTPEHKIYIEDYLQKRTGDRLLEIGEQITFSEELVRGAINEAQQLTPEQLINLQQYSALVVFL